MNVPEFLNTDFENLEFVDSICQFFIINLEGTKYFPLCALELNKSYKLEDCVIDTINKIELLLGKKVLFTISDGKFDKSILPVGCCHIFDFYHFVKNARNYIISDDYVRTKSGITFSNNIVLNYILQNRKKDFNKSVKICRLDEILSLGELTVHDKMNMKTITRIFEKLLSIYEIGNFEEQEINSWIDYMNSLKKIFDIFDSNDTNKSVLERVENLKMEL